MPRPVNVLWTSGWDSTYRVADLVLRHRQAVQPWYVLNPRRRSAKRELAAQAQIRDAIIAVDPAAADLIAPGIIRRHADIPDDPAVTAHLTNLVARSRLGYQYDVLARLAKAEDVTLELCIHRDDTAHRFLQDAVVPDGSGSYRLRPELPADDPLRLFERFGFPVFDLTKTQMQEQAAAGGFGHVMELTWFCHAPLLDGKPCGFCAPCAFTRDEGLARRVPAATPLRKAHYHTLDIAWRAWLRARRHLARAA